MSSLHIDEVQIVVIKPRNGLLAFASCVIERQLFLGDIALHNSPSASDKYRLVFPAKKLLNGHSIHFFYPINSELYQQIKNAIVSKYEKINNSVKDL